MWSLLTGVKTEEAVGFSVTGTSQKEDVFAGGGKLSKLIESVASSFTSNNSFAGFWGEFEGHYSESFGESEETDIIGDGTDDSYNSFELVILVLGIFVVGQVSDNAGQRDGESSKTWLVKTFVNDLIELGISSSTEEWVKLNDILGTLMRVLR